MDEAKKYCIFAKQQAEKHPLIKNAMPKKLVEMFPRTDYLEMLLEMAIEQQLHVIEDNGHLWLAS